MTPEIADIVRRARELKTDIEDRVLGRDLQAWLDAERAAARLEAFEEAARIANSWPLESQNMEDVLRWEKAGGKYNGATNAVAGSCNAIAAAIREKAKS